MKRASEGNPQSEHFSNSGYGIPESNQEKKQKRNPEETPSDNNHKPALPQISPSLPNSATQSETNSEKISAQTSMSMEDISSTRSLPPPSVKNYLPPISTSSSNPKHSTSQVPVSEPFGSMQPLRPEIQNTSLHHQNPHPSHTKPTPSPSQGHTPKTPPTLSSQPNSSILHHQKPSSIPSQAPGPTHSTTSSTLHTTSSGPSHTTLSGPTHTTSPGPSHHAGQMSGTAPNPQPQVKFENALEFLDQVKLQFAHQPKVYNQFLDIMKDFKAQAIDTPGVIARVSELFKGHPQLILGFNTFLPPGYKIEAIPEETPSHVRENMNVQHFPSSPAQSVQQTPVLPTNSQRKQPEFDHARNYVKKIKMRFSLEPHIYKSFLEILHTYHKEQHTIRDVYDQVATLFQKHPDLLEEFTKFLPDPVASVPPTPAPQQRPPSKKTKKKEKEKEKPSRKQKKKEKTPGAMPQPVPTTIPSVPPSQVTPVAPVPPTATTATTTTTTSRPPSPVIEEKPPASSKVPSGTYEELNFFYRVKQRLQNSAQYENYLKCLNLFSHGIISRLELVLLVKDVLGKHQDLFDWFKNFIGFDDPSIVEYLEKSDDKSAPRSQSTDSIDFKSCKRCGPSYRAMPKNFSKPVCSGRTALCDEVLNDIWVSVPTGSEDFGFKNSKKNQYEEMLFKCEDDRFELDLVIELNQAVIRTLEPLLKSIQESDGGVNLRYKLDSCLDALYIRSIERLYGERGPEVTEAMYANPAAVIPTVLARLKQKDQEWTKARREWNKIWREVDEKNYYKSLDHQSFSFKQNDVKKTLNSKVLLSEIKQIYQEQLKKRNRRSSREKKETTGSKGDKTDDMEIDGKQQKAETVSEGKMEEVKVYPHQLEYLFTNHAIYSDIFNLTITAAEKTLKLSKLDKEKIETFYKQFIKYFFDIENLNGGFPVEEPDKMEIETPNETNPTTPSESKEKQASEEEKESQTNGSGDVKKEEEEKEQAKDNDEEPKEENTASDQHTRKTQIFFGNYSFYIFFRLFQILFERLNKAKEMSKNPQTNSDFAFLLTGNKVHKPEENEDRYISFMNSLSGLLTGAKEQNVYEDECRSLFGIQAYILFTMDKLVTQLTRQLQSLLSEEVCSKLLVLYSYENAQSKKHKESLYYSNCIDLLGEERCFKFNFIQESPGIGKLTIQILDSIQNPPEFIDFSAQKQEKWSEFIEHYAGTEENDLENKKHNVFLKRNLKKDEQSAFDNLKVENGLESRICLSTYRLFFVEETEDFLYRKTPRKQKQKTSEERQRNLQTILEKKFPNFIENKNEMEVS